MATYIRIISDRSIPYQIGEDEFSRLSEYDRHKYRPLTEYDQDPIRDEPVSRERQFEIDDRKFYEGEFFD